MSALIILSNDTITFNLSRANAHGYGNYQLSMDSMYHPEGFFIPGNQGGNEVIDMIAGRPIDLKSVVGGFSGFLITPQGQLYKYLRWKEMLSRYPLTTGKDAYCVMSECTDLNQGISMLMHLTGNDVKKTLDAAVKVANLRRDDYVTVKISDIVKGLAERGYDGYPCMVEPLSFVPSVEGVIAIPRTDSTQLA